MAREPFFLGPHVARAEAHLDNGRKLAQIILTYRLFVAWCFPQAGCHTVVRTVANRVRWSENEEQQALTRCNTRFPERRTTQPSLESAFDLP